MRVVGPRTLLLLLSGVLVLTETRAGECGVGRERPLRGGARGSLGSSGVGGNIPWKERPRRSCPDLPLSPVLACPSLASRPLFSSPSGVRAGLDCFHLPGRTPPPPSRVHHFGPGTRAGRRSGRVSPLPAPRLPLHEIFQHRRVPARPRGAPVPGSRLRGRHAVRAVRQRHPESEDGAADAVGEAGGAGVLGSEHAKRQGHRTEFPSGPEQPARLLQPERGR